ncbi:MAG: hypothetical protein QM753_00425 [Thermomicrobiales bacterium]
MPRTRWVLRSISPLFPVLAIASLLMVVLVTSSHIALAAPSTPAATSQEASGAAAPTGTPPAVTSPESGEKDGATGWWRDAWLPLAILVFAALVIWWLLHFVRTTFSSSIGGLLDLAKTGKAVQPVFVNSIQQGDATVRAGLVAGPEPLVISGMSPLVVGTPQTFNVAAHSGAVVDGADIRWSSEADGDLAKAIAIQPAVGTSVSVTAFKPGSFTLHANHADSDAFAGASLPVTAAEPEPAGKGVTIPFFGHGYGSQVMAIVLMALATILAVRGIFGTGEVAVLFGAIAGYIFGVTKQGGGDSGT